MQHAVCLVSSPVMVCHIIYSITLRKPWVSDGAGNKTPALLGVLHCTLMLSTLPVLMAGSSVYRVGCRWPFSRVPSLLWLAHTIMKSKRETIFWSPCCTFKIFTVFLNTHLATNLHTACTPQGITESLACEWSLWDHSLSPWSLHHPTFSHWVCFHLGTLADTYNQCDTHTQPSQRHYSGYC